MTLDQIIEVMVAREIEHSAPFWEGAKAALGWRHSGTHIHCKYSAGSLEHDAFFCGVTTGHQFWLSFRPQVV